MESIELLKKIASAFAISGQVHSISCLGEGNVNETYLVNTNTPQNNKFVLQQINQKIFKQPNQIAENIEIISEHLRKKLTVESPRKKWKIIDLIKCRNGNPLYVESKNSVWRMISFAENTRVFQKVNSTQIAKETGRAIGRFHFLLFDLEHGRLNDTLPGFHHTPSYLNQLDQVCYNKSKSADKPECDTCFRYIERKRHLAELFVDLNKKSLIANAVIHGDPKINNILFDESNNKAVGMIDLDTVKPGLLHYDIGDCLRSVCNPLGEETSDLDGVAFSLDFAKHWIGGYLEATKDILSPMDKSLFFEAVLLICFELGIRFFTDYLNGNVYFKTSYKDQNLKRALVQFKLAEDIERKEKQIRALIVGL